MVQVTNGAGRIKIKLQGILSLTKLKCPNNRFNIQRDKFKRRITTIVAMDAVMTDNYREAAFVRDLEKAYCAFWVKNAETAPEILPGAIATGNWGCGGIYFTLFYFYLFPLNQKFSLRWGQICEILSTVNGGIGGRKGPVVVHIRRIL